MRVTVVPLFNALKSYKELLVTPGREHVSLDEELARVGIPLNRGELF